MTKSLLYVSQSTLRLPEEAGEIDSIVEVARARNAELGVTGALVCTQARFAQVLEGSGEAVDTLMDGIRRDRRHRDVTIVLEEEIEERRFGSWSMAYSGPSLILDRQVKPLLQCGRGEAERMGRELIESMAALFREGV